MTGRNKKGQFVKGHSFGIRFGAGQVGVGHKQPKWAIEKMRKRMKKLWQEKDMTERNRKVGLGQIKRKERDGYINSPKTRQKISEKLKKLYQNKENHPCWQGGKSFEPYSVDWTDTLKKSIRERDHYICQLCFGAGYPVHHIDYNKKNCSPENLITLCNKCNPRVNFNRKKWTKYFELWNFQKNINQP
jgi:hypothetical protein